MAKPINDILCETGRCRINCESCGNGEHGCNNRLCECKVTDEELEKLQKENFVARLRELYEEDGMLFNDTIREWFADEMRRTP